MREAIRQQQAERDIRQAMLQTGCSPYNTELEKFFDLLRRESEPKGVQGYVPLSEVADLDGLRRLKAMTQQRGGGRG